MFSCKFLCMYISCRSQWPHGLRRRPAAVRLLRSWVRIPPGAWMSVCCVLSGRGLCDGLITRPEESDRLWCVVVCDLETSRMRRSWPALGRSATGKKKCISWCANQMTNYICCQHCICSDLLRLDAKTLTAHAQFNFLSQHRLSGAGSSLF